MESTKGLQAVWYLSGYIVDSARVNSCALRFQRVNYVARGRHVFCVVFFKCLRRLIKVPFFFQKLAIDFEYVNSYGFHLNVEGTLAARAQENGPRNAHSACQVEYSHKIDSYENDMRLGTCIWLLPRSKPDFFSKRTIDKKGTISSRCPSVTFHSLSINGARRCPQAHNTPMWFNKVALSENTKR